MSFVLKNMQNLDLAGRIFGEGVGEGYTQGSDDRAIRKAVESLPPNASYRDILNAVNRVNTYDPNSKKRALENYAKSHELDIKEQYYQSKASKDIKKEEDAIEADMAEAAFLESIKDKDISPIDVYHLAREAKLPVTSAKRVSDLYRLNKAEDRRIKKDLTDVYDYAIKEIDAQMKVANNTERKSLKQKRSEITEARKRDLQRWEKGERNFNAEILGEAAVQEAQKPKFDKVNPEHQARAKQLFQQLGDKEKVREALRQEYDI